MEQRDNMLRNEETEPQSALANSFRPPSPQRSYVARSTIQCPHGEIYLSGSPALASLR
jgi:hypothetical protein